MGMVSKNCMSGEKKDHKQFSFIGTIRRRQEDNDRDNERTTTTICSISILLILQLGASFLGGGAVFVNAVENAVSLFDLHLK